MDPETTPDTPTLAALAEVERVAADRLARAEKNHTDATRSAAEAKDPAMAAKYAAMASALDEQLPELRRVATAARSKLFIARQRAARASR
jgi:hypothetical protein